MIRLLPALLIALGLLGACAPSEPQGGVSRVTDADAAPIRLRHADGVNALRAQSGLAPLVLSAELDAAASTHARDMSVQNRAWHFGSDLTSPRERAFRAGYRGEISGENISESADNDLAVLQSWLGFEDTRRIMLDPEARAIGLGWFQEPGGKLWWVQLIGE